MRLRSTIAISIITILALASSSAFAQGAIEVTTDRRSYEYGDTIRISATISNRTNETFRLEGTSNCQAQMFFDDFDSSANSICTADLIEIEFGPGSQKTWTWDVVPAILGLPTSDGEHVVVGYYPNTELSDTVTIEAPKYFGGRVNVGFAPGVSEDDIAPVKDSLNVDVLERFETGDGVSEWWQISGVTVEEAVRRYAGDTRFTYFEINRLTGYSQVVSAEDVPKIGAGLQVTSTFPNPCSSHCFLNLELSRSQTVRVALYDSLGREVKTLFDGPLPRGVDHRFGMDASQLATGVYVIHVLGENASTSRLTQVVR